MASPAQTAEQAVRAFVARTKPTDGFGPDTLLYVGGVGLDSLETAELSAVLEDELGSDPYSAGDMPQTMAEILAFYGDDAAAPA